MPKKITDLRDNIINAAEAIIDEQGLSALSIRSISARLGIAAATIYNYYAHKDLILAAVMHRRWASTLEEIDDLCEKPDDIEIICGGIIHTLNEFLAPVYAFWLADSSGHSSDIRSIREHKDIIFKQLEQRILKVLERSRIPKQHRGGAATTLTRLLFACAHYGDIDFKSISDVIKHL